MKIILLLLAFASIAGAQPALVVTMPPCVTPGHSYTATVALSNSIYTASLLFSANIASYTCAPGAKPSVDSRP